MKKSKSEEQRNIFKSLMMLLIGLVVGFGLSLTITIISLGLGVPWIAIGIQIVLFSILILFAGRVWKDPISYVDKVLKAD